ncbi:MAG: DUF4157 domain-containing protein [Flavobacterium circumlabens]|uniref:eCIS core domain-containing protein n=1 Tax=Flavobacterium circumlabens TaxID=2133765 RepID=UPI00326511C9
MEQSNYIKNNIKTQSVSNSLMTKTTQNKAITLEDNRPASLLQRKTNNTGLPDPLKSGIENLSGHSMDDVKVHYNSDKPARLQAHAYAQGTDIHIASGQEKHLPHEAWHVVQQKQGRVKPTLQMKGKVNINDDKGLEKEADVMGAKALQAEGSIQKPLIKAPISTAVQRVVQRLQIRFSFTQFLHGAAPTQDLVRSYFNDFIQIDYSRANAADIRPTMKDMDNFKTMTAAYLSYAKAYFAAEQSHDWTAVPALLDTLRTEINTVLAYAKNTLHIAVEHEYSNTNDDSWATANDALTSLSTISPLPSLIPMHPGGAGIVHPNISVIQWSVVKSKIPGGLHHLLRDIYTSWRLGHVMDERDAASRAAREKNPNVPGALRSWHVNDQKQLPANAGDVPANATTLHAHYAATSRHPYIKDKDLPHNAGPTGYAEYTGTGIQNDFHYSKIVLNYKTGFIYLTVTHYGLWNKKEDGNHEIKDKTAGSGELSAWFGISMTT